MSRIRVVGSKVVRGARGGSLLVVVVLALTAGVSAGLPTSAVAQSNHEGRCDWLAQVMLVGFNYPPVATTAAHGQLENISAHPRLYSLLGNTFGGSPSTNTFGLPTVHGRAPDGLHYYLCTTGTYPSPATNSGQCSWLGQVVLTSVAGAFNGTVAAHGELLASSAYANLFSLYGFTYGGSAATMQFGVPNLRGQAPPGLSYRVCTSGPYPAPNVGTVGRCNWIGQVMLFGFASLPYGTIPANGQSLTINRNETLYSLYQSRFGGNGTTTFAVPNLHGQAPDGLHYRVCTRGAYPARA
jgi:microcystin-dependent protein